MKSRIVKRGKYYIIEVVLADGTGFWSNELYTNKSLAGRRA